MPDPGQVIILLRLRREEDTVSFAVQFSNSKAVNRDRMTGLIEADSGRWFFAASTKCN
jgi:hypothetical protein